MTKKSPIPTTGPIATKVTDKAAGSKIPKPRIPIKCLVAAIKKATPGKSSKSTIVLGGTPAATDSRIAYFKGFDGKNGPSFCSYKSFFKGSIVLSVFWVKSGLTTGVGSFLSIVDEAVASFSDTKAVGESLFICTWAKLFFGQYKNTLTQRNKNNITNLLMIFLGVIYYIISGSCKEEKYRYWMLDIRC